MAKPTTPTTKHRDQRPDDEYMTVEQAQAFLDQWAREQDDIAAHNLREHTRQVITYAERVGIDWRTSGGLKEAAERQAKDADSGAKLRESGHKSPGRRGKWKKVKTAPDGTISRVSLEKVIELVSEKHRKNKGLTFTDVCGKVAEKVGYETAQSVMDKVRHLQWPDPRRR